ncbi:Receptor-type guanylate cyclase gcy [Seminavis robusta]|uniref:Receptor-type guanylate cyclase gcy n=1 Tax=Seminavis robusta TaxID=568900 RepID=A0A9N8EHA7_9STRA|nr:Receptor-type guanylate cyclase gcy [Seminavis robusta]|eukprot:Sro1204_g252190.1 Receptor-type guanylate cyclase gcy (1185) ;mRNA; r:6317-11702
MKVEKDAMKFLDEYSHDDADSSNSQGESNTNTEASLSARDEVKEVRRQSKRETSRVRVWRIAVSAALLITAISVTFTTYWLLVEEEDKNFRNVFSQFARTVGDAAIDQQKDVRSAIRSLSDSITLSADLVSNGNPTWPYFFPPMFEAYAHDYMEISKAEFVGISNIVSHDQRERYINYSTSVYEQAVKDAHIIKHGSLDLLNNDTAKYNPYVTKKTSDGFVEDDERDLYFVRTIQSPPPRKYGPQINWNLASDPSIRVSMDSIMELRNETTISKIRPFVGLPADEHKGFHSDDNADNPHCFAFHPVYKYVGDTSSDIVAIMSSAIAFDASMRNLLPSNVKGMLCEVTNNCDQILSYLIDGKEAYFQGTEALHDKKYDDLSLEVDLSLYTNPNLPSTPGHCMYKMRIYPTEAFESDYKTNTPLVFAAVVAATFLLVIVVYYVYDLQVQRRNELMIENAAKANSLVTNIIPDHLRDRLLSRQEKAIHGSSPFRKSANLKTFLNEGNGIDDCNTDAPLADLFVDCTVLFADITGFTAWSSVREPSQVFILLETLYSRFDKIAQRRRIFKVETVGDCYVAVCGLPDPRHDHSVAMCRFGRDIMSKMRVLTKELEVRLGPDTGELALRIGMHSGPVIAGVLRGERSRFQLFGDTMNLTSRLEGSSKPNQMQCSKETAEHLIKLGKGGWVQKRLDPIAIKGKGSYHAYWVNVHGDRAGSAMSALSGNSNQFDLPTLSAQLYGSPFEGVDDRTLRLIDWNVETLLRSMKEIGARRSVAMAPQGTPEPGVLTTGEIPLNEVCEIIPLPEFDAKASRLQIDPDLVEIPVEVVEQLHHLVSSIAKMYHSNPFHNFDHASHVVMSVTKLLSRIVAPTQLEGLQEQSHTDAAEKLHDHTYGLTSDPMTFFACAFAALIHDVDHAGVSNAQLVKEGAPIAEKYKRSVAEQNSLTLSWELLMDPGYKALRDYLFPTNYDLLHFRQLLVNTVMSTDIVDIELKKLRNARWDKAFKKGNGENSGSSTSTIVNYADDDGAKVSKKDEIHRKATIVLEHIIQASDISHTMQHWHVYRRWNQNFFEELYVAYLNGRMEQDPGAFWYKGEFGFFDFYIIPLTKKLKDCGVFGVSSDEYLNYALRNREEWELCGEQVVAEMVAHCRKEYGVKAPDGSIVSEEEAAALYASMPLEDAHESIASIEV